MKRSMLMSIIIASALGLGCAAAASGLAAATPELIATIANSSIDRDSTLDPAARFAAAGRFEEAFDALGPTFDSLRAGILASLAGRPEFAAELLRTRSQNAYVEQFRLYYLGHSLYAAGRLAEAYDAVAAIPYAEGCPREHSDRFFADARELAAFILAASDSLLARDGLPSDTASLSGPARFGIARALQRLGNDSLAAKELIGACGASWKAEDRDLLGDALAQCEPLYGDMTLDALRRFADKALSHRLYEAARGAIEHILERDPRDHEAMILKVQLLSAKGRKREALALSERVLASAAAVSVKKQALRRCADLEYDLGRYDRSVELCRQYYRRFPDDAQRDRVLAFGARIEVARGNLRPAYEIFSDLVRSRTHGSPANLDEEYIAPAAALACILGNEDDVHRILEERLQSRDPQTGRSGEILQNASPRMLYWLWRTGLQSESAARARTALVTMHPSSPYAFAASGHMDTLLADMQRMPAGERIRALAAADRAFLDFLASSFAPDSALIASEAFSAYRFFLDCGLEREAAECSVVIRRLGNVDAGATLVLYREARARGFYRLALRLADAHRAGIGDRRGGERLSYPIAYAGTIEAGARDGVPAELILAVMREESAFDPRAVSPAGAVGLMQLMPATARWINRKYGWAGNHCIGLHDPICNVATGSRYLAYLLARFDGSLVGALAAYNGGEGRMGRWRKQFLPADDPMIAKELIGPAETRAYVGRVLDSLCRYWTIAEGIEGNVR